MAARERLQEFPGRIPPRKKRDMINAQPRKSRVSIFVVLLQHKAKIHGVVNLNHGDKNLACMQASMHAGSHKFKAQVLHLQFVHFIYFKCSSGGIATNSLGNFFGLEKMKQKILNRNQAEYFIFQIVTCAALHRSNRSSMNNSKGMNLLLHT